ncbi:hypothetical protein NZ35_25115 [Pseudomonas chlororaphis]|uniref:CBM-cenC domain-containing protein n=1 Tax=Pseudomonas chlororaphis TaxID=587753 RepID=A0A0A6D7Q6_9PSED|nr:hypothetical protein NZ35_25115 [Pseudomonas chlororaphis]
MTNLIRNGEFYEGEKDWSVSDSEHVKFNKDDCKITSPGYISQDVTIEPGVEYALAARMKTAPGFTACVELTFHPSDEVLALRLENASNWQVLTDWILAPPGTTRATVLLQTEGAVGAAASQFGSLNLQSLENRKPKNILVRIVAWWRSHFGV